VSEAIDQLESEIGRTITPKELAKLLRIDARTVIKYAARWGGVEVSPGKYRFFENLVRRKLDAQYCVKEWQTPGQRQCHGKRDPENEIFSSVKSKSEAGSSLGK
jgi:hypothetical protein